ncbi:MAG: hypothetical protein WBY61_07130, partial [Terriglobales bacterium]
IPALQFAEKLDFGFVFGWRSAGVPQHARFWRDGVERFIAAINALFSMPALAAEGRLPQRERVFQQTVKPLKAQTSATFWSPPRVTTVIGECSVVRR